MKKITLILMLIISIVANADWEVVISGNDRETETNNSYPSVAVLYDYNDGKYDIYRFTWSHGYWLSKGTVMDKAKLNEKDFNPITEKPTTFSMHKILIYKGKKCVNLTEAEVKTILKNIQFKEADDYM